jgi:outer membrane protein
MKKLILMSILMFILSISSYGQVEKGNFLLGGTGSVVFRKINGVSGKIITLSPSIGYFVTDKIATGATLPIVRISAKYASDEEISSAVGIAPFVRYYFTNKGKSAFFGLASLGIIKGNESATGSYTYTDESSATTAQAGIGFTYFLNQNVGLETILGYTRLKYEGLDARSNVNLSIGFQIYFGSGSSE